MTKQKRSIIKSNDKPWWQSAFPWGKRSHKHEDIKIANRPYENAGAYDNSKVYETHRDNNGYSYNGAGGSQGTSHVRVPSIKRSVKIWKNFYKMFPEYKEILDKCLSGEMKCSAMTDEWIAVEIPNTTHIRTFRYSPIFEKEVLCSIPPHEVKHNNCVKLKIIK